ncbi:MAG: type II toxin-antitoxin system VapB family antitoxin [Terriglobales bacterium]
MTKTAKLFLNGSSQAVRLPREFRFPGDRVRIRHIGAGVLLEPISADPAEWLARLKEIPADPSFMVRRSSPRTPRRRIFE